MTDWTPPTYVVAGTEIDASKHNDEVVDNLKHLHEAKVCRLGRLASLVDNSDIHVEWDWEVYDTMGAWSATPGPERIYPNPAGFYRVSGQFTFPASATGGIARIMLSLVQGAVVTTVASGTSLLSTTRSTTRNFSAIVEMDGIGEYLVCYLYQDSGAPLTINSFVANSFDLEWIGA